MIAMLGWFNTYRRREHHAHHGDSELAAHGAEVK
jgi:hypothetical protein